MDKRERFDHISVVIPAFNESKNLQILTTKILKRYPKINIVIIDDSDKEKNIKLKRTLKFNKQINIISRFKKMGRGSAVIEGFKFSLKNKKIKILMEMDADLAHDPDELPIFLQALKLNDMIVGSRYLSKSKIIKWPITRLIQSKIINFFLKIWLGLNLTDYTNGYRVYSRHAAEFLVKQKLREKGFISLSETAFKLRKADFKISEVAISFRDRKFGESSADFRELMASLYGAIRIRFSDDQKLEIKPFYFGIASLIFVYFNYSFFVWDFLNKSFGLVAAKVLPEIAGIVFFLILSKTYLLKYYRGLKLQIRLRDTLSLFLISIAVFVFHFKQFYMYFWKDDFYFFLNRAGTAYSFYNWGPWLSSYSLWVWEMIRTLFGYSILPYQLITLLSHVLLAVGVYFLTKYLSKSYFIGFLSGFLIATTSITFQAFQWVTQPMNFAWQGFFICVSIIALVWEVDLNKMRKIPYLSSFLYMAATGAGIARIGFVLPLISITTFLVSIKYFSTKKWIEWLKKLVVIQTPFYFMSLIFFAERGLFAVRGIKSENVTLPLYKLYLYVIGVFSFPPEFYLYIHKQFLPTISSGLITVAFGLLFLSAIVFYFLLRIIRRKEISSTIYVGFFWLVLSALFYSLFGPHLPASDAEINVSTGSHHLSYLGSVGALMIWSYFFYHIGNFLLKIKKPFGFITVSILVISYLIFGYQSLSKQYDVFLDFPKGISIVRQKFFFDTYRQYISKTSQKVNIFYDDGALARKDNYKPNESYYWSFWDPSRVAIVYGDDDLKKYLDTFKNTEAKADFVNNLHYIYTSYDSGLVQEDLSPVLRNTINSPLKYNINETGRYYPAIFWASGGDPNYFNNPVVVLDNLNFPAILTPKLNISVNVQNISNSHFVDLRAGIFSQLLNNWSLPSNSQLKSLVEYYSEKPSESNIALSNLLDSPHVADKMVCGTKRTDSGIMFLIVWMGEPDTYLRIHPPDVGNNFDGYLDRYYSICSFDGDIAGVKSLSVSLPNLGSVLRKVVIIPLTKQPVSVQILNGELSTPNLK